VRQFRCTFTKESEGINMASKKNGNGKTAAVLAAPLRDIATHGEKTENAAGALLKAIRDSRITDLSGFDTALTAAFDANGWNTRPGRPAKDRRNVPHTVRTYVWEIRAAYRAGLDVTTFRSMYDLRMARQKLSQQSTGGTDGNGETAQVFEIPADVAQDLEGVRVLDIKRPNGALFHDLVSLFISLPADQRSVLGRQLSRLLHQYQQKVPAAATAPTGRAAAA
jgi:hypothetical protein